MLRLASELVLAPRLLERREDLRGEAVGCEAKRGLALEGLTEARPRLVTLIQREMRDPELEARLRARGTVPQAVCDGTQRRDGALEVALFDLTQAQGEGGVVRRRGRQPR